MGLYFYGNLNQNHLLGTFFKHQRTVPTLNKVEFVTGRMSYIVLRGHSSNITVLNMHALTVEKSDDSNEFS
jgi:hypothetical protein